MDSTTDEMTDETFQGVYDYTLFSCLSDETEAKRIHERLQKMGYNGYLHNNVLIYDSEQDENVKNSVLKFFLVSNHCGNNEESKNFMFWKKELVAKRLLTSCSDALPLWLVAIKDLEPAAENALYGLMSLAGYNPNSARFEGQIKKLMASETLKEIKLQKINNFIATPKSRQIIKEHITADGKTSVNVYNINTNNSEIQNLPDQPTNPNMRTTINNDGTQAFLVPDSFWRSLGRVKDYLWHDGLSSYTSDYDSSSTDTATSVSCSLAAVAETGEDSSMSMLVTNNHQYGY